MAGDNADKPANPRPEPGPDAGVAEIQADIDKTRDELGQTVEALAAKTDVKARVHDKAVETRQRAVDKAHAAQAATRDAITDDRGAVRPVIPVGAVVTVLVVVVGVLWWRRRR
ncbi:DUF3618 domain-containing protein [Mycolicibacterium goodii]|uniref:DUF3618 domain-containing protein n=1 Tax=Mycolicibacterium goodii TaxID=134601 RepID=UPI001BDDA9DE|nr:DUF3618 domain-containing protein [Mycolicibacterium goodii]MBU8808022.1 DUF3618 domain-containing protein [Mycolicibacterium goodii]